MLLLFLAALALPSLFEKDKNRLIPSVFSVPSNLPPEACFKTSLICPKVKFGLS